jgi:formamidopyrimidine-DNA glycosylase
MPELPDVLVYQERLQALLKGRPLERLRLHSPFVLRSVHPPPTVLVGHAITAIQRIGKRLVLAFPDQHFLVIHLMIAGRLRWRTPGRAVGGKATLAEFGFGHGTLYLTEAASKKRASLHVVEGAPALAAFDRGGLDVLGTNPDTFARVLRSENHTLKRALTDPRLLSGIGNAYSDEILHRARLSPLALTQRLGDEEMSRLYAATRETLSEWIDRTRQETGEGFPEKVTAFREGMAVHGRFRQPCPVCGSPVQRIRYAENETNYCARCQTGGRLLADRSLSRLLKEDWPRTLEEAEGP